MTKKVIIAGVVLIIASIAGYSFLWYVSSWKVALAVWLLIGLNNLGNKFINHA